MGNPPMINLAQIISAAPDQVSSDLGGEAVILNLKNGTYYGLNEIGAFIWQQIQQPQTVATLRDRLLAEYEVEPQQCESELLNLLSEMAAHDLIEVRP
ncbi:MAG: lasso peptide biosynthesis PqqD family chaperone [Oscillochloris sp.]|nr:lasso peptide biosynthesis PqqD family chaperone [Oscillochloris sp.]